MNQDEIAAMFRAGELIRRQERRATLIAELRNLLQRLQNEGLLLDEILTSADKEAHKLATQQIQQQKLIAEKELSPGYWTRLWRALLNK